MNDQATTEARQRVLDAAEQLFAQRGYNAVTLRDVAAAIGIRHTSLYHHVPGGKEALFVEVTERHLQRHQAGLTATLDQAGANVRAQLQAAANWLLDQPPVDLIRMIHSDMPSISPAHAHRLTEQALHALIMPIENVLQQAKARGEIDHRDVGLVAGGFVGMIESLHAVPDYGLTQSRRAMAADLIDALLHGLYRSQRT